jgi:hypothetical protein
MAQGGGEEGSGRDTKRQDRHLRMDDFLEIELLEVPQVRGWSNPASLRVKVRYSIHHKKSST